MRRLPHFRAFSWLSTSSTSTLRPDAAAAVATLLVMVVLPVPPLLMATAIIFMSPICAPFPLCSCAQLHCGTFALSPTGVNHLAHAHRMVGLMCTCALLQDCIIAQNSRNYRCERTFSTLLTCVT